MIATNKYNIIIQIELHFMITQLSAVVNTV